MVKWYTSMAQGSMVVNHTIYQPTRHKSPFICEALMGAVCPKCLLSSTAVKVAGGGFRGPHYARMRNTSSSAGCLLDEAGHQRWQVILRALGHAAPDDSLPFRRRFGPSSPPSSYSTCNLPSSTPLPYAWPDPGPHNPLPPTPSTSLASARAPTPPLPSKQNIGF